MDANCFGATCKALETQSFTVANKCAVPNQVNEQVDGCKFQAPAQHGDPNPGPDPSLFLGLTELPGGATGM
jgi:hypothetical protein